MSLIYNLTVTDRKRNTRAYLLSQVAWLAIILPAVVQIWQNDGLSFSEILYLQGLFGLSILLMEFPTGLLADIWSRKTTLIIGHLFVALGSLIYSIAHGFNQFLVAEFTYAIGMASISGS
ncbi:MAG: hypothetical protein ACXAD7_19255, partial [Candidatus Kariarchaeaceae archaeon]